MSKKNGSKPKRQATTTDIELASDADLNSQCQAEGMHPTPSQAITVEQAEEAHRQSKRDRYLQ